MDDPTATPVVLPWTSSRTFEAPWWLRGGHPQTVFPALVSAAAVPGAIVRTVEVERGTSVELHVNFVPGGGRGTVLLVHGLGGDVESRYMRRSASQALERGWNVARLNLRNCGGTAALASTLYNAGQSGDIGAALQALEADGLPRPFGVVSFSLGANQTLLYAEQAEVTCAADAIVAVNPPIDLEATRQAMQRVESSFYHLRYTRLLCEMIEQIRAVRDVPGPAARWRQIRSVATFDRLFTLGDTPYATVDEYYAATSSGPRLGSVTVPTLILASEDDPVVPVASFPRYATPAGHPVRIEYTSSGGHVGYWHRNLPRYWAAEAALDFIEAATGAGPGR